MTYGRHSLLKLYIYITAWKPITFEHLQFLVGDHAPYSGEESKPAELEDLYSTEWTRDAITGVVNKGLDHLFYPESFALGCTTCLGDAGFRRSLRTSAALVEHVQLLHLDRLRQPHSNSDTFHPSPQIITE